MAPACPAPCRRTGLPSVPHIKARAAARGRSPRAAGRAGLRASGWPAAGRPGRGRGGRRPPPPWLPTVAQPLVSTVIQAAELRLRSNPPQPYAHVVILAAQKPQTGTSKHELKERACHIALSALLR